MAVRVARRMLWEMLRHSKRSPGTHCKQTGSQSKDRMDRTQEVAGSSPASSITEAPVARAFRFPHRKSPPSLEGPLKFWSSCGPGLAVRAASTAPQRLEHLVTPSRDSTISVWSTTSGMPRMTAGSATAVRRLRRRRRQSSSRHLRTHARSATPPTLVYDQMQARCYCSCLRARSVSYYLRPSRVCP